MWNRVDSLYIVMPAYNEAENLPDVVREWYPVVETYHGDGRSRLVIVNDGSRDDTLAVLQKLAATHPQLVVLDKKNSGHGATLLYAYQYALDHGADYIFQTDSDGQTRPSEFAAFWAQREAYPVLGLAPLESSGYRTMAHSRSAAAAAWVMAAVCVGLGFLLPERGFLCVPVAVASAGLTVFLLRRNLGGMCGDISGAAITLGEACGCAALLL